VLQPNEAGLGTHLSLDLAGNARFGPDVEYVDDIDYSIDSRRGETFYSAIREYWPDLQDGALQPSFSGIRPKVGEFAKHDYSPLELAAHESYAGNVGHKAQHERLIEIVSGWKLSGWPC
jgi:L-2-hydroxyglutarate oxidase LhgO